MEFDGFFIYKTTSPLTITVAGSSRSTAPPREPEPYYVLRNVCTSSTPLPETSAPEFYSLDGDEDSDDRRIKRPRLNNEEPNFRFKSPMLQLHKEILDFCDFLSPTVEEQVSRNAAVETVSNVIKSIWPNCKVEVFGSFKTGLFLPTSDVDMVILESRILNRETGLRTISRTLYQRGLAIKIQVFGKARVPIIRFVEKRSGIAFDISFDMHDGPKAAKYIQDAVSKWPPLRPLCLVLKVFLKQRRLNEVHSGGLGSFALLAMLIAMLRNSAKKHSFSQYNLGVLLVTFFDMYGCKLNTFDVGVSCNEGGAFFPKISKRFLIPGNRLLLSVQNPLDPEKDIGKNSYKYIKIKCAFRMACSILTNTQLIMSLGPDRSILGTIIRPDEELLERKGGLNGDMAFADLLPGAGALMLDEFCPPCGPFSKQHIDDCEEPLCEKEVVGGDDGVGGKAEEESKKVLKVKKKVKVKKMKKVIVIKEKNITSAGAGADADAHS